MTSYCQTPDPQIFSDAAVFTPLPTDNLDATVYLSLSEVRQNMNSKSHRLSNEGQERMNKGMPLRKGDFTMNNTNNNKSGKNGMVAKLSKVFDSENVNPNNGHINTMDKKNTMMRPRTPGEQSEFFTDDYWGVPRPQTPQVSPEKVEARGRAPVWAPLSPKRTSMASPKRAGTKSPGKKTKKSKSARKAQLKRAMLELTESREEAKRVVLDAVEKGETVKEKVMEWALLSREWAVQGMDEAAKMATIAKKKATVRGAQLGGEAKSAAMSGAKLVNEMYVARPDHFIAMVTIVLVLLLSMAVGPATTGSVAAPVAREAVVAESVVEASAVVAEVAAEAVVELEAVVAVPEVLYDITAVEISGISMLKWRVEGPSVLNGETVDVVVLVDDEIHFRTKESVTMIPEGADTFVDMSIDMAPLAKGLHSFLIVVASTTTNYYRESGAKFIYEMPVRPYIEIGYPSHGEVVERGAFGGVIFETGDFPEGANAEGWTVQFALDGEVFNIPFFDGEISLDGIVEGTHWVEMKVLNGEGKLMSDGSANCMFEVV